MTFLTPEEQSELWARKVSGDKRAIEELLEAYRPLATSIAMKQIVPDHVDREDLISNAMIGLFQAIDRFDPATSDGNYARHFSSFARRRIGGQILDYIKSKEVSWAPRGVFREMKARYATEAELQHTLGRAPTEAEVAKALGVEPKDLPQLAIQVPMTSAQSNDENFDSIAASDDVGGSAVVSLIAGRFADAASRLDARSQQALWVLVTERVPFTRRPQEGFTLKDFDEAVISLRKELRSESIVTGKEVRRCHARSAR